MKWIGGLLALGLAVGVQTGLLYGGVVLVVIYLGYIFFGFEIAIWMALWGGLWLDGARVERLGVSSAFFLVIVGALEVGLSRGILGGSRSQVRDVSVFAVLAGVEAGLYGGGVGRWVVTMTVMMGLYGLISVLRRGAGTIRVRRVM